MDIRRFDTEEFYGRHEFTAPHLLSVSDCETVTVGELLSLGGASVEDLSSLRLSYTDSLGAPALRQAIACTYETVPPEQVVVLGSPVEGLYLTLRALLEPGDEAVVLAPAYDALLNLPEHLCGNVVPWPLQPTPQGWRMDLENLERLLTPRTRVVVVNFPNNPTGFLPTRAEFTALVRLLEQRGVWLLSDEMYWGLEHSAEALPSAADVSSRCVVLGGLSKAHGLPGLRSGWLVVRDEALRARLVNWKHYTSICAPGPSELLATIALAAAPQLIARNTQRVLANLALAAPFFERWRSVFTQWRPPQAGPVALARVATADVVAWCEALAAQHGVVLLPATFMRADGPFVRFGFGRSSFPAALAACDAALTAMSR